MAIVNVLIRVSIAVMKHHNQRSVGRKGSFSLHFHVIVHHQRKSGQKFKQSRNQEPVAETEAMEKCSLLDCST